MHFSLLSVSSVFYAWLYEGPNIQWVGGACIEIEHYRTESLLCLDLSVSPWMNGLYDVSAEFPMSICNISLLSSSHCGCCRMPNCTQSSSGSGAESVIRSFVHLVVRSIRMILLLVVCSCRGAVFCLCSMSNLTPQHCCHLLMQPTDMCNTQELCRITLDFRVSNS